MSLNPSYPDNQIFIVFPVSSFLICRVSREVLDQEGAQDLVDGPKRLGYMEGLARNELGHPLGKGRTGRAP